MFRRVGHSGAPSNLVIHTGTEKGDTTSLFQAAIRGRGDGSPPESHLQEGPLGPRNCVRRLVNNMADGLRDDLPNSLRECFYEWTQFLQRATLTYFVFTCCRGFGNFWKSVVSGRSA